MTACKPAHAAKLSHPSPAVAREPRRDARPEKPDKQLWETDRARAFEAAVRWFLAVSRAA
jgi:hypothetical protein